MKDKKQKKVSIKRRTLEGINAIWLSLEERLDALHRDNIKIINHLNKLPPPQDGDIKDLLLGIGRVLAKFVDNTEVTTRYIRELKQNLDNREFALIQSVIDTIIDEKKKKKG